MAQRNGGNEKKGAVTDMADTRFRFMLVMLPFMGMGSVHHLP